MTIPTTEEALAQLEALARQRDWTGLRDTAEQLIGAADVPWVVFYHAGRARLELKDAAGAEKMVEAGMARFPSVPQLGVLYGIAGAQTLPPEAAATRWQALHARLPDGPGVRLGYAHALRVLGRGGEAEALLADGVRQRPDHVPTLVQYAEAALLRADFAAAADRFAAARAHAPDRPDLAVAEINARREAGQWDQAEALARTALATWPDASDIHAAHAAVAAAREDWPAAASALRRVVARDPANVAAWEGLVRALARQNDGSGLEAAIDEGLRHHPTNATMLMESAKNASARKDWAGAVARWQRVIEQCPPSVEAYFGRIDALIHAEQVNAAEIVSAEAIGFAPENRALLIQNAELAALRLDTAGAKQRWQALKHKFPNDPVIDEGMSAAQKRLTEEKRSEKLDEKIAEKIPVRGSIRLEQKPTGERREPLTGPTALDRLKAGMPPAPRPKPKGLWQKLLGK